MTTKISFCFKIQKSYERPHSQPGDSWAMRVCVYIPNMFQKHPAEFEKPPWTCPSKILKYELLFNLCKSVLSSFVRDLCLKKPSGKYSPQALCRVETLLSCLEWVQICPMISNYHQNPKSFSAWRRHMCWDGSQSICLFQLSPQVN